ncbi:SIMPL domain-containing protein [Pseudaquabacterium rugosum]|uniref:SIMPL domain-containing protein n=1 Tax=Pseudaquabacterium rugosum TaxID=2984194 RepID=A0ABU9B519_9BURK
MGRARAGLRPAGAALVLAVGAALSALAPAVQAQTSVVVTAPQDVVHLSAQAAIEVPQDQLTIVVQALREGADAAGVQQQLRQQVDAALTEARRQQRPGELEVRSGGFSLSPRYVNRPEGGSRINGWQGQAELVIEGRDMAAISALAGRLSAVAGMSVQRVQTGLSRAARERVAAEVQSQALGAFRARASAIARDLGFASYSLRELTVGEAEAAQPPGVPMLRMAVRAEMADAAPPVAPGQATVSVQVNGSVQLSPR